ncbi:putative 50s ribosomal protein L33 [Jaminaea rosea]|uniref:Large ribosomal subunit protein bL33m n=1 Tax=Jaminaea rosea TaxID=1569628 RepID=A0A316UU86_9BASI|nr:putative 50s ribosomal protein L33 [Jaminaea rosea]PWN28849.1 putative 50s ribosomal protein L33 [Jaminaea rosea]
MAASSRSRIVIARLFSTAGTGYAYTTVRPRIAEKLVLRKYDPIVKRHVLFRERGSSKS